MSGGDDIDSMSGGDGNDDVFGEDGDDGMEGDAGDDLVGGTDGVVNNDEIDGGAGINDLCFNGDPDPVVNCEEEIP